MAEDVQATIYFIDGTDLKLAWPRVEEINPLNLLSNVRKALEADRLVLDADGDLILVPVQNIKYIHVTPGPILLPKDGVIRNVSILG
jgi:hypothetical protein